MNWHARYLRQAEWTRSLREYLFEKAGLSSARRVLEVGCGTGAILGSLHTPAARHGLDLDPVALTQCKVNAEGVFLAQGNALALPYPDRAFDIVFCHFLLLWVKDPLQVVREMARVGQIVLALAEPDYGRRVDQPAELSQLGDWQTQALIRQGADPFFGSKLAETFYQSGIRLEETGPIQRSGVMRSLDDWENEWDVIQADLAGLVHSRDIQKMKKLDENARRLGKRVLHVPTYFAWGRS